MLKAEHELWVKSALAGGYDAKTEAAELSYITLIDLAVGCLMLEQWWKWTPSTFSYPAWKESLPDQIELFERRVMAAIWSGVYLELEVSIFNLAKVAQDASKHFQEHCEDNGHGYLRAVKFFNTQNGYSQKDRDLYVLWEQGVRVRMAMLCRAANYFAHQVRQYINPQFFVVEGKFTYMDSLYEYTESECQAMASKVT